MNDEEYFNQVAESKEWSDKISKTYRFAYNQYREFCGKSFMELLMRHIKMRKIKHHTTDYNFVTDSIIG